MLFPELQRHSTAGAAFHWHLVPCERLELSCPKTLVPETSASTYSGNRALLAAYFTFWCPTSDSNGEKHGV